MTIERLMCSCNAVFVIALALLPVGCWVPIGCGVLGWLAAASFAGRAGEGG